MARYNTIFAGAIEKTQPQSVEFDVDVDTAPGTICTLNNDQEFVAHATQGVRGSFFILGEQQTTQSSPDDTITANQLATGYYPDQNCFFYVLVENNAALVNEVTLLTSNGSGVLEVAASGDEVLFVAAETYTNSSGSNQLATVRPYVGSVA